MSKWIEGMDFPEDASDANAAGNTARSIRARASFSRIISRAQDDPNYVGVPGVVSGVEIARWMESGGRNSKKKVEESLVRYCAIQYGTTVGEVEKVRNEGWTP